MPSTRIGKLSLSKETMLALEDGDRAHMDTSPQGSSWSGCCFLTHCTLTCPGGNCTEAGCYCQTQ